jgi:hypothetical protein
MEVGAEMAGMGGQSRTFEQGRNLAPRLVIHAHSPHPLVILPKKKTLVWDRDDTARIRFWHDFLCFLLLRFGVTTGSCAKFDPQFIEAHASAPPFIRIRTQAHTHIRTQARTHAPTNPNERARTDTHAHPHARAHPHPPTAWLVNQAGHGGRHGSETL